MKDNKGITLIALVITIIVLLILAGVSIALLTGDNGVLNRATTSQDVEKVAAGKDQVALAAGNGITAWYEDQYTEKTGNKTYTDVKDAVTKTIAADLSSNDEKTFKWTAGKVESATNSDIYSTYVVNNNGSLTWTDHFKK